MHLFQIKIMQDFLERNSLNKYTGARGKSGASDANAEYVKLSI